MDTPALLLGLRWTAPEIVLVATIIAVVLADLTPLRKITCGISLAGLAVALGFLVSYLRGGEAHPGAVFGGAYAVDAYATAFKIVFVLAAALVLVVSLPSVATWTSGRGEYFALLLSCTFGMTLMAGANDLLTMYLALEFASITSYILSGLLRKNRKSAEASLKYIIYGAGASGFMIYGMSFLYGLTGTLDVGLIGERLNAPGMNVPPTMTLVTSVLIMAGFGYKIAAVPFHMWCPDVYEGAPTPVTAFFSVGPKAAGFAMLARFVGGVFPGEAGPFEWKLVIALLAFATMAVGNFGALQQQNLKRLLAYSSIAHAGYLLVAFVAFTDEALRSLLFYIVVYVVMNLGAFILVILLEEKHGIETVDGCRGFGWKSPALGVATTLFMASLTGLPPTAGFIGKVLVFSSVIDYGRHLEKPMNVLSIGLVVAALVFSVVSLFYYMRIVAAMFLAKPRDGEGESLPASGGVSVVAVLWLLAAATLVLGLWWGPLRDFTLLALPV
jgi:NADH-quinone oxidoreductase subunit N